MKTSIFISLLSLCLFSLSTAAPPVPFSGKLAVDGKNFHGNARFSFSIVDGQGDEHWRHSQEQGSMIENVVLNGRYLVLLGGQGMKALPPRLFLDYDQLFLRVQVDLQDGQGIRLLEPDQRITSSPYALTAELARLAEKASVADAVSPGSITQDMLADGVFADLNRTIELSDLPAEVLQGLSRTITLNDLGLDVVAELNSTIDHSRLSVEVREDLNRTTVITREMLPQNVRDDLNRTIGVAQLSAEVNEKLNRDFTIQPGSISKSLLGQDVLSDLNRTVQRHHLSEDLRAELNRTIRLRDLAPEVISDLNDSIQYGSITLDLLSSQVRNDLNRTITKSMLAEDIKNDLNRTITLAMLPQEVRDDLNRTIGGAQLSSEVAGALKPVISGSPVSIHAHAGEGATLHVQANGGNLSYQWKKEGVSLAGATSRVLTISDLNASQHEGNYTVVVSNTFGSTTSSVAQIDVNGSLTEGLVAWWKFDETAGDVAYDSSGNGNDGNLTNGPTWSEGKIGGALSFDGTNDMVRTNLSGSYNEDFTWSAWIKTTDTQGGVLGLSGDTWEVGGASFYIYQGSPKVDVHSVGAKLGNFNLSSNTWTHYLLTVKDSGGTVDPVRIFVNGLIEIDSTLNWFTYNGQNFNLRIAHVPTHGEYYEGLIDDVRIYDRVLSTVEVKALYELGEGLEGDGGSGAVVSGEVPDGSISLSKLSNEVRADLNRTITLGDLAPEVIADLNDSIQQGSITLDLLSSQVRNDLNRTITKSMLSQEVRNELNSSSGGGGVVPGSLLAVPANQSAPSGYSLYQSGEPKDLVWEEKAPVSVARYAYDGVEVLGGKIYFVGGRDGSGAKNIAERYDPATNTWETLTPMSDSRVGMSAAVLNSKLYAIGGVGLSSVEIFDPLTDTWSSGSNLPTIVHRGVALSHNGKIYLIGGQNSSNARTNQVLCFDPSTNQWTEKADMPTPTNAKGVVLFADRIWVIGGNTGSSATDVVVSYNPLDDTWRTESPLLAARQYPIYWTANNFIYAGGGWSPNLSSLEYYSSTSNKWNSLNLLPQIMSVSGSVILENKIYLIAGETTSGVYSNKVFAADLNASMSGVFDLYRKDGNASNGVPIVQAEVADGSVTTAKIASNTITTSDLNEQILKYLKPEITLDPQAPGLIFNGQTITLHSRAEGKYLTYQWYKNGQALAGANNKRYVIEDVNGTLHDGNYTLVVSNDFGSITTQPTELLVDGTPTSHSVASISMDMIFCPPGTFTMGSPTNETGRGTDETQHQVTLSHGFYLGKYEVTQAQYQAVMNGNSAGLSADPSQFKGSNRPVEKASWEDAQIFLSQLNTIEQTAGRLPAGWKYVLPTEAQWEYACRAGSTTAYSWGNDINSSRANYNWDGGS